MQSNQLLQRVSGIIQKTVPVFRIVLLAYSNKEKKSFTYLDQPDLNPDDPAELHLFVLANVPKMERHVATDTIEQRCLGIIPVHVILMNKDELASLFLQGNRFAITVMQSSQVIYNNSNKEEALTVGQDYNYNSELICLYKRAMAFRQIAQAQFQSGEYGMAAFCVQQAAELFLCMLSQMSIGYRISTHNLERHLRHLQFYVPETSNVFPRGTLLEKQRLQLLKSSFVKFMYKSELTVTEDEVEYFMDELYKLQYLAESVYYTQSPLLKGVILPAQ